MNIKDYLRLSRHLLTAIALYPTQQNWKCLCIRNRQYTEFHFSNLWRSRYSPWEKARFFSPLGLTFKEILITKPKKSSSTQSEL